MDTLRVHEECNARYQKDEAYFVWAIGPAAAETRLGGELWRDLVRQTDRPQGRALLGKSFREFLPMHLPGGRRAKRFDGKRVWNVIWKIVRGVFYLDTKRVLPEDTQHFFDSVGTKDDMPPELYGILESEPVMGEHPEIFSYRMRRVETGEGARWVVALQFWAHVVFLMVFADPDGESDVRLNPSPPESL
ncbi:MAG: hypothetical protein ACYDHF_05890 [Candidatus Cryosericum sp.]